MMAQQGKSLADFDKAAIETPFEKEEKENDYILCGHQGSGSGGYADFIFHYAAKNLFQESDTKLEFKNLRNPDFKEAVLEKEGKVLLRFSIANGFRNIQNLVQKLKRGKSVYDYVEVMACPTGMFRGHNFLLIQLKKDKNNISSGCLNGGAQIRPQDGSQPRELANKLESEYDRLPKSNPESNSAVKDLYKTWFEGESSDKTQAYFQTQYHEIEKMNAAISIKW